MDPSISLNKKPKILHRRNKEEITRQYICPIEDCLKSYGAESSLKTHVKLKHPHIVFENSPRKQNHRAGRPLRHQDQFDIDVEDCWSDYSYIQFLQIVTKIHPHNWIRGDQDEFADVDVQNIISTLSNNKPFDVPKKLLKYLQNGKTIFKHEKIQELYTKIINLFNQDVEKIQDSEINLLKLLNQS